MHVIVGLGNPGPEYAATRHNVGFMVIDALTSRCAAGVAPRSAFGAAIIETRIDNGDSQDDPRTLFVKPLSYMNRSGSSVSEIVRFYKIDLDKLLVIVDDAALPLGHLRFRASGTDGGHNGLADVARHLGTIEYSRLRFGIGSSDVMARRDYVLARFSETERVELQPAIRRAADAVIAWHTRGMTRAMNEFNTPADRSPGGAADN